MKMTCTNFFCFFCTVAGSVFAAEHNFRVGKQYTFQSKSESMVGIPKLADQDTGLRMKRTIKVVAKNDDTLIIIVSRYYNFNIQITFLSEHWLVILILLWLIVDFYFKI